MTDSDLYTVILPRIAKELHEWGYLEPVGWHTFHGDFAKLDWLLTGNGMLEGIEKMRERGYRTHLCVDLKMRWLAECFVGEATGPFRDCTAPTLPEAFARAAFAALTTERDEGKV